MKNDNVFELKNPESIGHDLITDILRNGAKQLLAQALESEINSFLLPKFCT